MSVSFTKVLPLELHLHFKFLKSIYSNYTTEVHFGVTYSISHCSVVRAWPHTTVMWNVRFICQFGRTGTIQEERATWECLCPGWPLSMAVGNCLNLHWETHPCVGCARGNTYAFISVWSELPMRYDQMSQALTLHLPWNSGKLPEIVN